MLCDLILSNAGFFHLTRKIVGVSVCRCGGEAVDSEERTRGNLVKSHPVTTCVEVLMRLEGSLIIFLAM